MTDDKYITIGRDPQADISTGDSWNKVSFDHGGIEYRDGELYLYDHSSNGTTVNNQRVHNGNIKIQPDDRILLGDSYELDWNTILRFFPELSAQNNKHHGWNDPQNNGSHSIGKKTEPLKNKETPSGSILIPDKHVKRDENYGKANAYSQADIDATLAKWNWGAFFCSWLWAIYHKIYWAAAIIVLLFIPYLGAVCALVLSVFLGMNGSKMAWKSRRYDEFSSFVLAQKKWANWGMVFFLFYLLILFAILDFMLTL